MKKIIIYILILLLLGAGAYFIFRKPKVEDVNTDQQTNEEVTPMQEDTTTPTQESEGDATVTEEGDFTGFSSSDQVVGSATEDLFDLQSITDTKNTGFHRFEFNLSTSGTENPYVTAKYNLSTGVIRVELNSIETDKSGIGYQKERTINEQGIIRIYHAVTSSENKEIYDIGLSKSTTFKLALQSGDGQLKVILDVKYPGEVTSTIDLGSTEFSIEKQLITGVTKTENASIQKYSYSTSGGVLKFVWSVTADGEKPIPSVSAEYVGNILSVKFESLSSDKAVSSASSLKLPSSLAIDSRKEGVASIYDFTGLTSQKEFKLSATTSPNQVILEIQL